MSTLWLILAALAVLALWPLWLPPLLVILGGLLLVLCVAAVFVWSAAIELFDWLISLFKRARR